MTSPADNDIISVAERALAGSESLGFDDRTRLIETVAFILRTRRPNDESLRSRLHSALSNQAFHLREASRDQLVSESIMREALQ